MPFHVQLLLGILACLLALQPGNEHQPFYSVSLRAKIDSLQSQGITKKHAGCRLTTTDVVTARQGCQHAGPLLQQHPPSGLAFQALELLPGHVSVRSRVNVSVKARRRQTLGNAPVVVVCESSLLQARCCTPAA